MDVTISADPTLLDIDLIHHYLSQEAYWALGRPREVVERSLANSLCFGAYHDGQQVGFARAVTDRATFAYVADVFVLEAYRGRGIGKLLVEALLAHPDLQGLRRIILATQDAQELYARFGFRPLTGPERWMEKFNPSPGEMSTPDGR